MQLQVRVFRNADCLSNNNPCVRETIDYSPDMDFNTLIKTFKVLWPDSIVTFNI